MEELFGLALGLLEPWRVNRIEFSEEGGQLDLYLDFTRGYRFPCPECGKPCPVHDTEERTWRHLNFFPYKTYLHARLPRVECEEHKVKTVKVPWARPGTGFTLLFEALVMVMGRFGMTVNAISRLMGEHDTLLWRIENHYVEEARAREDFSEVKQVGMDETSRAKGHQYVTVFMDLDEKQVLFATEGKDAETVKAFKEDLQAHGGQAEQVKEVSMDMSKAFQKGVKEHLPEAEITFDEFHLMQGMNKAVDEVRRQEQKDHPELKKSRYIWLKNEWNLTQKQAERFDTLRKLDLKTGKAYAIRSVFQDLFTYGPEDGEAMLKSWYFWATHSRMEPIIQFAKTIKEHWDGVVRWFTSQINNGLLEGTNSLIQAAKARSRGFRNPKYLITTIYLIGGKLDFQLPNVLPVTHTK